jgi:hypothetical protein
MVLTINNVLDRTCYVRKRKLFIFTHEWYKNVMACRFIIQTPFPYGHETSSGALIVRPE